MNSDILSFLLFLLVSKAAFSQHHQEEYVSEHLQESVFSYPPFFNSTFPQPPGPTKLGSLLCFCWLFCSSLLVVRCSLLVVRFLLLLVCPLPVIGCLYFFLESSMIKSLQRAFLQFFFKCFFSFRIFVFFFGVDFVWD